LLVVGDGGEAVFAFDIVVDVLYGDVVFGGVCYAGGAGVGVAHLIVVI